MSTLSAREERIALALAAAAIPPGEHVAGGDEATVKRLEKWIEAGSANTARGLRGLLWACEVAALASTGKPLTKLPRERAEAWLGDWSTSASHARRSLLRAVLSPIKVAHFDDEAAKRIGCKTSEARFLALVDEEARWKEQVIDGNVEVDDVELECDVVVIGSGAGGAACAYDLASRGHAVVILEEGDFHRRSSFTGKPAEMSRKLFRDQGMTLALGNVGIPIWAGKAVGGSTVINSGTCYRASERVFARWRSELGLEDYSARSMDPYYAKVEAMLQVAPAKDELTGGIGRVIARGAGALGLSHHPLARNAPDCDGQGVCCFGCPTGAKRSTDVSYVPETLKRGGLLVTAARAEAFDLAARRVHGVRGRLGRNGRTFHVKASAVVVAGGALMTPVLLKRAGIFKKTPFLGKNLSIHPASKIMAIFDETIDMNDGIPQGYAVDALAEEGIMFEGASMPLDLTAVGVPWVGAKFTRLMERYKNVATFGFMIEDTSRGSVRPGLGGSPLITYDLNEKDTRKMARAASILCEIYLAAGAKRVAPMLPGFDEVRTASDISAMRNHRFSPSDFEVTAYHPLGTARIGVDPQTSVCAPDHETHEVERLFVADGSSVPTALGVNPQMTIMAMALRCAEAIDARLG